MKSKSRLLLIDDHALFRGSIGRFLAQQDDLEIAGECATIQSALDFLNKNSVDLILLDYDLGNELGIDLLAALRRASIVTRVLLVTGGMGPAVISRVATDAMVCGLLLKHSDPQQLLASVRSILAGGSWWDPRLELTTHDTHLAANHAGVRVVTARQREILLRILEGLSNKEIAAALDISESAVKASIQELFLKAGVRTRSQLVRVALERHDAGWLRP